MGTLDLNWIVSLSACVSLLLFWSFNRKSGKRGLMYALVGCSVIIALTSIVEKPTRLVNFTGMFLVVAWLVALLVFIVQALRTRRHIPRYQAPEKLAGRCSRCGYNYDLTHTNLGWLCVRCQTKLLVDGKL